MAIIDKNSITVQKTGDPLVFMVTFEFTDDPSLDVNEAWKSIWYRTQFVFNTNMSDSEFTNAGLAAMDQVRKPTTESNLETTLRSKFGTTVIRTNPIVETVPMNVKIVAVDDTIVVKTQGV
jgi:hypothetical protein